MEGKIFGVGLKGPQCKPQDKRHLIGLSEATAFKMSLVSNLVIAQTLQTRSILTLYDNLPLVFDGHVGHELVLGAARQKLPVVVLRRGQLHRRCGDVAVGAYLEIFGKKIKTFLALTRRFSPPRGGITFNSNISIFVHSFLFS